MSSDLKLTVLIPTYNRSSRLNRSLPAYLKNKRKDIEFFIVDNCSPDDTEKTVKKWMKKDRRIRYFKQYTNVGANRSLFIGMLLSKAPLVMIMPDDDYMTSGFVDAVIDKFERYPEISLVHSAMRSQTAPVSEDNSAKYPKGKDALFRFFMLGGAIPGLTFRKSKLDFNLWKLDNRMYPQVLAGCDICLRSDIYVLENAPEYIVTGTDDNAVQMTVNRPKDYGVFERLDIIREISERFPEKQRLPIRLMLSRGLLHWAVSVYFEIYELQRDIGNTYWRTLFSDSRLIASPLAWQIGLTQVFASAKISKMDKVLFALRFLKGFVSLICTRTAYAELIVAFRYKILRHRLV